MPDEEGLLELAQLGSVLMQRTLHDLAGALGALDAALELAPDPEAGEIARDGATLLKRRLRLLRGVWQTAAEPMPVAELRDLLPALPGAGRIDVQFERLAEPVRSNHVATTLAALVVAAEAMPRGGRIELSGNLVVTLEGAGVAWPPSFPSLLASPAAARAALLAAGPRTLAAATCAAVAHRDGVLAAFPTPQTLRLGRP